jgi:hypothetical protein
MALWPLRKIQAFIFLAGRTGIEASWARFPPVPPAFYGMTLLCLLQTMIAMTVVSGICVALHLQLSRDLLSWLTFGVLGTAIIFNYTTLLFRDQWRHFAHEFSHFTLDDFAFSGMGLVWCAIGFGALFFWFGSIIAK